jgi:hypothetical protein
VTVGSDVQQARQCGGRCDKGQAAPVRRVLQRRREQDDRGQPRDAAEQKPASLVGVRRGMLP